MEYRPDQDIFASGAECIINTVNCVGVMGKGLARSFAETYPAILEPYRKACESGAMKPGGVQLIRLDRASRRRTKEGDLLIANVATKDHWRDPSRIEWVDGALRKLARALEERGVKSVALPKMGAGLGGLDWNRVRPLIERHFAGAAERGMRVIVLGEGPRRSRDFATGAKAPGQVRPAAPATGAPDSASPHRRDEPSSPRAARPEGFRAYAGIGARDTPPEVLIKMVAVGEEMARRGFTLRSGAAPGADSAFEEGCDRAGGEKEIFLPWPGFQKRQPNGRDVLHYADKSGEEALAAKYHPAWERLGRGPRALMARNANQMLGQDLNTPSKVVICYTRNGEVAGGTGQSIRMARDLGVKVLNLGDPRWKDFGATQIAAAAVALAEGKDLAHALVVARATLDSARVSENAGSAAAQAAKGRQSRGDGRER